MALDIQRAAYTVATAPSFEAAASELGVSVPTLWRVRQQPDFKADYAVIKAELREQMINRVKTTVSTGLDVLTEVATSKETPPGVRVAAAKILLTVGYGS
jgi:hypothetical protein